MKILNNNSRKVDVSMKNGIFKRLLSAAVCLVMMFSLLSISIYAEDDIRVFVNDELVMFDQPPIMQDGRTLVPLRAIFEAMGAEVDWNSYTQTVTGTKSGIVVVMQVGNNVISRNGQDITLDVPPQIVNDRTLVPVRAVAESFNAQVNWYHYMRMVRITAYTPTSMPQNDFQARFDEAYNYYRNFIVELERVIASFAANYQGDIPTIRNLSEFGFSEHGESMAERNLATAFIMIRNARADTAVLQSRGRLLAAFTANRTITPAERDREREEIRQLEDDLRRRFGEAREWLDRAREAL